MCRKVLAGLVVFLIVLSSLIVLSGCEGEATKPEGEGTVTFDLNDEPQDFSRNSNAVYNSKVGLTSVYGYEESRSTLVIYFPDTSAGTFESPTGGGEVKYLSRGGIPFTADDEAHGDEGQFYKINVTSYGAVGEPIEGTFSAYLHLNIGAGVEVTVETDYYTIEGSFSVIRRADK